MLLPTDAASSVMSRTCAKRHIFASLKGVANFVAEAALGDKAVHGWPGGAHTRRVHARAVRLTELSFWGCLVVLGAAAAAAGWVGG